MSVLVDVAEVMDFITVRDQDSYDILRDIGVKNRRISVTADAALNVVGSSERRVEEIFRTIGFDPKEEILAINVNTYVDSWAGSRAEPLTRERFVSTYAAALDRVIKELKIPILFVVTQHDDMQITREVMAKLSSLRQVALVSNLHYSHYDIIGVLSKVSLLFAMRLHAMILASSSCTPILGLAYQPKCQHYFNTLDLKSFSMSFDDFNQERIYSHLMHGWESRTTIRKALTSRIPRLKSEAKRAAEIVAALDAGKDLDNMLNPAVRPVIQPVA
jgi:polysaccharide pyruvyl transferase WcaK-like protein